MNKEEYKAKKIEEFTSKVYDKKLTAGQIYREAHSFLSQTIDELWALPEEREALDSGIIDYYEEGWNACRIVEAERMRDKQIKENI